MQDVETFIAGLNERWPRDDTSGGSPETDNTSATSDYVDDAPTPAEVARTVESHYYVKFIVGNTRIEAGDTAAADQATLDWLANYESVKGTPGAHTCYYGLNCRKKGVTADSRLVQFPNNSRFK